MQTNPAKPINLEQDFLNDIKDQEYTRFLFLTYGLDAELLSLLPQNSKALVFYNRKAKNELKSANANHKIIHLNNHSKIYCMWGSNKIKCWLGSFNLTKSGISRSIEWAANFEGNIVKPNLELEEIANLTIPHISDNIVINQIIDLVSKVINKDNPVIADRLFQTNTINHVLLHNQFTKTIFRCIERIAQEAKENVAVTYITPFVNKTGIENFSRLFSPKFTNKQISFCIMTNMPDENSSENTFLNSQAIAHLEANFRKFVMLKRNKEKEGTILKSGVEISSDPLHMKLISISFTNMQGEPDSYHIFTSSNLTAETWKNNHENIEIGVWIREKEKNEKIQKFIEDFKSGFSEYDQQELQFIDEIYNLSKKGKFEEVWIEDLVKERLSQSIKGLIIDWPKAMPEIRKVNCVFLLKNLATGQRYDDAVPADSSNDSLFFQFPESLRNKNTVIEYVRFSLETCLRSPAFKLKKQFTEEIFSPESLRSIVERLHAIDSQCNAVFIGNSVFPLSNNLQAEVQKLKRAENVLFVNCGDQVESLSFYVEFQKQPHFASCFFRTSSIDIVQISDLGQYFKVSLETDINIDPAFDTIQFYTDDYKLIEPVAFARKESQIDYYFPQNQVSGLRLTARAGIPFNKYFTETCEELIFPKSLGNENSCFWKNAFSIAMPNVQSQFKLDKLISPGTTIKITADQLENTKAKLLTKGYYWKEESLYYNQPTYERIETLINCEFPYSRIAYWGVLETQDQLVQLVSAKQIFTIKNIAIKKLELSESEKIVDSVSSNIGHHTLGWIIVDPEKFIFSREVKLDSSVLKLEVWQNGKKLEMEDFKILKHGKKWAIPLAMEAKEESFKKKICVEDFQFLVSITDPCYSDFAWAIENRKYTLFAMRGGLKLGREPPTPLLDFFSIFLRPTKCEGFCLSTEIFSNNKFSTLDRNHKGLLKYSDGNLYLIPPKNRNSIFVFSLSS